MVQGPSDIILSFEPISRLETWLLVAWHFNGDEDTPSHSDEGTLLHGARMSCC